MFVPVNVFYGSGLRLASLNFWLGHLGSPGF